MSDPILRGFELVRGDGSIAAKYRPTELAARQAAADFKWHQWRDPKGGYELRALVSVSRDGVTPPAALEAPLKLDADEPAVAQEPDAQVE